MTPDRAPLWDLSQQSRANLLMALLPMLLSGVLIVAAFLPARGDLAQDEAMWNPPYQTLLTTLVRYAALEVSADTPAVTLDARRREVLSLLGDSQRYPDSDGDDQQATEPQSDEQEAARRLKAVAPLIERRTPADTQRALQIVLELDERSRAQQDQARLTLKRNLQALESTMLLAGLLSGLLGSILILTALNRAGHERHTRERNESQQREALGMAAHELRRPMQALLLATDALRHTDNARAREKLLRSIEGAAEQMTRRSELERLDAMYVQMTALPVMTDLTALVARHENMRVRVRRPSGPLLWMVDATQVQQIVENLVENAIKYSDGPITVTLDPPTALWGPVIRVTDHGPGLHPSLHEQAFQPGMRLATHVPGRGLGLPLARRLAQVNRAEVTLHDTPGGGLDVRVAFHLPD
ncbi:sensor histidine kinase [Deinococcus sp. PEB2-63]